jgi:hypothetical protein
LQWKFLHKSKGPSAPTWKPLPHSRFRQVGNATGASAPDTKTSEILEISEVCLMSSRRYNWVE